MATGLQKHHLKVFSLVMLLKVIWELFSHFWHEPYKLQGNIAKANRDGPISALTPCHFHASESQLCHLPKIRCPLLSWTGNLLNMVCCKEREEGGAVA